MPSTLQLPLKLKDPRIALPMVDVSGAFAILGEATEDQIRELADIGWLWAWDVSDMQGRRAKSPRAHFARRGTFRFLARSLTGLQEMLKAGGWSVADLFSADFTALPERLPVWDQVLTLVLPKHTKPFLSASECKRALNLRRQHFLNLVTSRQLPGTQSRFGPGGSPVIAREDFIRFLETRVVGGL